MPLERCTVNGAVSRATSLLDLTIQYRNAPTEEYTGLPRAELENAIKRLRGEGWELESQCANPTADWYTETYTLTRPSQTES